jgi:hypothetical protein
LDSRCHGRLRLEELTQIATDVVTTHFGTGAVEVNIQAIVFQAG